MKKWMQADMNLYILDSSMMHLLSKSSKTGPVEPKGQGGRLPPPQFLEKFAIFSSNLPL